MALAFELVRLRTQSACDQQTINDLRSRLTTTKFQLGDYKDVLSFKEDHIILLEGKLAALEDEKNMALEDITAQIESQRSKFQEVLDSSCSEYYLKGYKQVKVGRSPKVEEESSS